MDQPRAKPPRRGTATADRTALATADQTAPATADRTQPATADRTAPAATRAPGRSTRGTGFPSTAPPRRRRREEAGRETPPATATMEPIGIASAETESRRPRRNRVGFHQQFFDRIKRRQHRPLPAAPLRAE